MVTTGPAAPVKLVGMRERGEATAVMERARHAGGGASARAGAVGRGALAALMLVAALAGGLVLLASRHGLSTSPDGAVYVGTARELASGHGLDVPIHFYPLGTTDIGTPAAGRVAPTPTPLVTYAPLEPVLIAVAGPAHVYGAARAENAGFFAAAVLLVGLLLVGLGAELWVAIGAQLVVALSLADFMMPTVASEPAALFLTVAALGAVLWYRRRPHWGWLVAAAAAVGAATLVRYAAGGLIIWLLVALLPRWRVALGTASAAAAPLVGWFAYQHVSGLGTGHSLGLHIDTGLARAAMRSIADWVLPNGISVAVAALGALAVIVVALAILRYGTSAPRLLVAYAVIQILVLAVAHTVVDAGVNLEPREFIYPFVAMVAAGALALPRGRAGLAVVGALVALAGLRGGFDIAGRPAGGYVASETLRSIDWQTSPILLAVRRLPSDRIVYSNAPDAIYVVDGRATSSLPETQDFSTLKANPRFDDQMAEVDRTLHTRGGYVVYVRGLSRSSFLPSEQQVRRQLGLRLVQATADGAIYALPGPQPTPALAAQGR